ncbi:MAG: LysR substrate-binding domain-containing protein [Hyphomicrobiales bacterium]|jgi:DNA-binding transcriptional LysR family regulator|nr:LysR substrate-binding domain-containing protein [Hyphomicrobiales bacterium]
MKPVNLPTDLLRSFVTVSDHGGYTKAGAILGRTQPAISLQMRRLEDLVGKKLFAQKGRHLALTADGSALAVYARQILRLNDEAIARFGAAECEGEISIGVPSDYVGEHLQDHVARFIREHPDVTIKIINRLSPDLLQWLASDELDVVVAVTAQQVSRHLVRAWVEQPIWIMSKGAKLHRTATVPLAVLPKTSEFHKGMIMALDAASKPWRIAHCSCSLPTLLGAVHAGIGVASAPRHLRHGPFQVLSERDGFPPLERLHVGLFYKHDRLSDAAFKLVDRLHKSIDEIVGTAAVPNP